MFFSQTVATVWIVFGVSKAHDPDSASALIDFHEKTFHGVSGDTVTDFGKGVFPDGVFPDDVSPSFGGGGPSSEFFGSPAPDPYCWRAPWCGKEKEWCPSVGNFLQKCGMFCKMPVCPEQQGCNNDRMRCPDGSYVSRDPGNFCNFEQCPVSLPCGPERMRCPDGSWVERNPLNNCQFHECPSGAPQNPMFTCKNGWQRIPLNQVCNGIPRCNDGSDESFDWGCSLGIGGKGIGGSRRLEDDNTVSLGDDNTVSLGDDVSRRLSFLGPDRACCYGMTSSCLACSAGVSERTFCRRDWNKNVVGCEKFWKKKCCRAGNAKCLSCVAGQTEQEYCKWNPTTPGCEQYRTCCKAFTAECMSCSTGLTEEEYCKWNPTTPGCEPLNVCCMAYHATCKSCNAGQSEEQYCGFPQNRDVPGCEPYWGVGPGRRLSSNQE